MLTGAGGQLGRSLRDRCPASWRLCALDRAALDITDAGAVARRVATEQPDWIVNAAAHTAVDGAESDRSRAMAVNRDGASNLARAAQAVGARLVQPSTDYVFDGRARRPYTEHDATDPLNAYGHSKLLGEQAVLCILPQALVVRTSAVYSEYGHNFVKTMLRLARQGQGPASAVDRRASTGGSLDASTITSTDTPALRVVADQHTRPTWAGDLADALIHLIESGTAPAGIYHYCGATTVSWHAFAQHIFACARQLDKDFPAPTLQAITADAYPGAAIRPAYSVLSCEKMSGLGVPARPLHASLPAVVRAILDHGVDAP